VFEGSAGSAASSLTLFDIVAGVFSLANATFVDWNHAGDSISIIEQHGGETIIGSSESDLIYAGGGGDTETGGGGANGFMFDDSTDIGNTITDFSAAQGDFIGVNHNGAGFSALGLSAGEALPAADFTVGTKAVGTNAQFIWNSKTSTLSFDPDGTGSDPTVQIATLTGVTSLTASNIHVY
jgi:Ca2+-binding RTX toxin-like protein